MGRLSLLLRSRASQQLNLDGSSLPVIAVEFGATNGIGDMDSGVPASIRS